MVLGLGVAHQVTVENWFGTTIGKPVREMRDYAGIVRAIFCGEDPPQCERFQTRFRFMGYAARPDLPLYIAALSPAMLRLAGQIGDGVMLWLCNPNYIRDVVVPEVTEGRKRAGKTLEGFDVVAAVPAAITEDVETARASLRSELIPYFSLPFYRAMIERSGFGDEIGAFDEAMQRGAAGAAAAAISDRFLEQLTAIGSAADAEASVRRYPRGRRHVALPRRSTEDGLRRDPPDARRVNPQRAYCASALTRVAAVLEPEPDRVPHRCLAPGGSGHRGRSRLAPYDDRANPDSLRAQMGRAAAHEVGARVVARLSARIARENLLADSPVVPGKQLVLQRRDGVRHLLGGATDTLLSSVRATCHKH